ncbi:MAG: hypothetical protein VCB42_03460, partial [Myxococcota bacterium]
SPSVPSMIGNSIVLPSITSFAKSAMGVVLPLIRAHPHRFEEVVWARGNEAVGNQVLEDT